MMSIAEFRKGFEHVLQGFTFLKANPSLWKWTIAPFLIAGLIVFACIGFGFSLISGWVGGALAFLGLTGAGFFVSLLQAVIGAFLWIVYLIIVIYGTFLITTVLSAPFFSLLSERTLMIGGYIAERPFRLGRWIRISVKMLVIGLMKSLVFLLLGLVIFICSFIPGLNVVSSYLAFMIMAFDSMDYSFEIYEMSLVQRFRHFQSHLAHFAGMGGFLGLTLVLPGATLLVMPVSVIGSALTLGDQKKKVNHDPR